MKAATPRASANPSGVKLFAKSGEANKPRLAPSYNLLLTLFI
jgi:hypothetical protein